jgi:hypothetical protein
LFYSSTALGGFGEHRRVHTCNNVAIVGSGRRKRFWQEGAQVRTEPRVAPDASNLDTSFGFGKRAPKNDLGSLILGDDALHLQQQIIFRALAEWPI